MDGLRSYSDDVEGIAKLWRGRSQTRGDDWRETSKAGDAGGEASGYFVTSGTLNGYAKPPLQILVLPMRKLLPIWRLSLGFRCRRHCYIVGQLDRLRVMNPVSQFPFSPF